MISLLQGKVFSNSGAEVGVSTAGGVGYLVKVSPSASKKCSVGSEVTLETYLVVREDAFELYGFASEDERSLFKNVLTVSGVGPKTALHLLSLGEVEEIVLAISRGDIDRLTKVSGIGKKTAERIVIDLKSKIKEQGTLYQNGTGQARNKEQGQMYSDVIGDVLDALVSLGYSALQAREAVRKLEATGKTSEELLREALRIIK